MTSLGWVGLDFETYGAVDLRTHGLERYVSDPTFMALIAVLHRPDGSSETFDFVHEGGYAVNQLGKAIRGYTVVGHNVGFEERVLKWMGLDTHPNDYIDSAVVARVHGGSGSLAQSTKQFLAQSKMEEGVDLIKLFCIPGIYQAASGNLEFDKRVIEDNPALWDLFIRYCHVDAKLSLQLATYLGMTDKEFRYAQITHAMNKQGWVVDRDAVEEMYARYLENLQEAQSEFALNYDAKDLNLNSLPQLKKWCADRGVKATSFDTKHVEKLKAALERKLADPATPMAKVDGYREVHELMRVKQILGGSSLKKLKVILDTISLDDDGKWRLRDQYVHCGAGQSLRTSGRSVQMQNLKRLSGELRDIADLFDFDQEWTNDEMAENLRQVFTSSDPNGFLIVGDFSSIESRGLAYLAGADWKVEAFRKGLDVYKVLAQKIYSTQYSDVTKTERQTGKVGELSCGYGAGGPAVQAFAENMGVHFTEAEAADLVRNWRAENPEITLFWAELDGLMHKVLGGATHIGHTVTVGNGIVIRMEMIASPQSLVDMYPAARTLKVSLWTKAGRQYMSRLFHGAYESGRNVRYFKPSKKKTGEPWSNSFIDPKTHQRRFFEIYGGKMAGILTQSFCRELFFEQLADITDWLSGHGNVELIGQFHDEVVLDWKPAPAAADLESIKRGLEIYMSTSHSFGDFPMAAEIKHDYRYTK